MMSGNGVSSRSCARAGMKGRKLARIGFSGFVPTMSGNSLGGFHGSIFAIRICRSSSSRPNELRASSRPPRPHSQDPSIKQERYNGESDAANDSARGFESGPTSASGAPFAGEDNDRGNHHADNAFADDQAGREQHAELLGRFWFWRAVGAAIEEHSQRSCRPRS